MLNLLHFLGYLFTLIQGVLILQVLSQLMKRRQKKILVFLGWFLLSVVMTPSIFPQDPVNITLVLPVFLAGICLAFEETWLVKISAAMIFYPIIMSMNFLYNDIFKTIFFTFTDGSYELNITMSNLSGLVPIAFWYVFWKSTKGWLKKIHELLDRKSWIMLDVICAASFVALFSFIYFTPEESYKVYAGLAACMVTNIGCIWLASYLADSVHARMERKNLRLSQDYYRELEKNQQEIRRFRHDMKNHFMAVGGLLTEGRLEEAQAYFTQLSGHMEARNRQFCKNSIVNAVLNAKYNQAQEEGIDCFFHIGIEGMMDMDDVSLCSIFANTLDNAIEACAKMREPEKRRLSVKARYVPNGNFTYEIVNSKENPIKEKKGRILTDKGDDKSHGLGLASVKEIVEKYGGTMEVSYTQEEFRVVILV